MKTCGIYAIIHIATGRMYIGQSKAIEKRAAEHKSGLRAGRHHCAKLQRAFNKYGEQAFEYGRVLELCEPSDLTACEQRWIDAHGLRNLFNVAPFANSVAGLPRTPEQTEKIAAKLRGQKRTEEQRRQQSERQRGKPSPKRGTTLSAETRAKISAVQIGKKLAPEHRAKISTRLIGNQHTKGRKLSEEHKAAIRAYNADRDPEIYRRLHDGNRGRKRSAETRAKMAAAQLGKKHSDETRAKLSEQRRGKTISPETRARIAESVRRTKAAKRETAKVGADAPQITAS